MRRLSGVMVILLPVLLVIALILSGCSTASPTPAPSSAPPAKTTGAPIPAATTSAPPPAAATSAPVPAKTSAVPSASSSTSGAPIRIGVIASTSGFFAALGEHMVPGAQMAVDKVNASGGLLGRKVELMLRDDQADPSVVVQKAAELKAAGCVAIVGTFLDSNNAVLCQWGTDNKVLISAADDTVLANRTTKFSKYLFFNHPINLATSNAIFQSVSKQADINSVYFLSGDVIVAHDIYNSFWAQMKKAKPTATDAGSTWVSPMEMDFSSIIGTILNKKPNMIISGLGGPQWPAFIKQAGQFGLFKSTKIGAIYGLDSSTSTPLGKDTPEGLQGIMTSPFFLDTPEMKAFNQDFMTRSKGQYASDLTLDFYTATMAVCEAIKSANSTDQDKVIAAWEKLTLNTPVGTVKMDAYDHQLEMPIWWITTKNSPDYPIVIGTNLVKYQDGIYPTKEEIQALGGAK
jgi:branched-chain amino acid transport system substrate-binding protein